ncbi:MAG: guanine deaminase [Leptolyngbyaceae cyanobacterium bins.59]|nr:guanine deaminase [Leptolyngbyaceae cyanobacterium bins.59]
MTLTAIRGSFLDFLDDPFYVPDPQSVRYIPDGLLVLEGGRVKALGPYLSMQETYATVPVTTYSDRLILPGFIDIHTHYPQMGIIAAYGEQLLGWLNKYTFPAEGKFCDLDHAHRVAGAFLDELLRNGTTTALVLATVHPQSADAFFAEAERRNMRMVAGKVMMDRMAPDFLLDTAESSYEESRELIQKWHKKGRLLYAVTPRFAITSTEAQLKLAGQLLDEFPDVYLHTHLSENRDEVNLVAELFPDRLDYLDVYDKAGLLRERSIFAHCIHLDDSAFERLSQAGAAIAFCPTSNLFVGSGLFNLPKAKSVECAVKVGLATDVGAGTSFSMLQTACEAYKVAQLQQNSLSPFRALFLATLGGAKALCLDDRIGNFEVGKEADFVVLDLKATPLMAFRNPDSLPTTLEDLADQVFSLVVLGDDRAVQATYVAGELAYERDRVA